MNTKSATKEQVDECMAIHMQDTEIHLGQVLLEKGYIDKAKLKMLATNKTSAKTAVQIMARLRTKAKAKTIANKMIKKAKSALEKGDIKKAIKLAKAAKVQGKLGQVQSSDQKSAGPWLF